MATVNYRMDGDLNLFEILVGQFYEIASNMEWEINLMNDILDGQHSLNRQFMYLRSELCVNKFGRIGQKKFIFYAIKKIYFCKKKCIFAKKNVYLQIEIIKKI